MKALRIVDWDKHYETAESRRIVKLQWIATPNGHDSMGYCDLMDHENGLAHFGVWNLILQVASKCPARGLLIAGRGPTTRVYTSRSIAVLCRCLENIVAEAIIRLISIGWLEEIDYEPAQQTAGDAQQSAGPATTTGQDRTGQDRGGEDKAPAPPAGKPLNAREALTKHLRKLGLPATTGAVTEWADLCSGRASCTSAANGLTFITWAVDRAKADGVNLQYPRQAALYADRWAEKGAA